MKEVVVVAQIRAREEFIKEVERASLQLIAPARSEEGCLNYDLHRNADDPALFMFHETWASREALDRHLRMPYLDGFDEQTEGMLAAEVEITFWEKV